MYIEKEVEAIEEQNLYAGFKRSVFDLETLLAIKQGMPYEEHIKLYKLHITADLPKVEKLENKGFHEYEQTVDRAKWQLER